MSKEADRHEEPVVDAKAEEALRISASRIQEKDLEKVVAKADTIERKCSSGHLARLLADVKTMLSMVRDYWNGSYRKIPFWSIASVAAALLYIVNPLDLIPDAIPILGQIDDAAVVAACLLLVRRDLAKYEAWKARQAS